MMIDQVWTLLTARANADVSSFKISKVVAINDRKYN